MGMVLCTNLLMVYSILERYPLHMGHLFAEILSHKGKFIRLGAIFAGPYITRLIRGMRLMKRTQGMKVVDAITMLRILTLVSIRIIERRGNTYHLQRHHGMSTQDPGL